VEQYSSLITFENSILCERLRGLYKAFDSLLGSVSITNKITDEYYTLLPALRNFTADYSVLQKNLYNAIEQKDKLSKSYLKLSNDKLQYDEVRNKVVNSYKTSIKILKQDLLNTNIEKDRIMNENILLEKK
jgi:hypothetical protein